LLHSIVCIEDNFTKKTNVMATDKTNAKLQKLIDEIVKSKAMFKLKLDSKTTITLKTAEQLKKWMELYPKAQLIS